jgi:hypothetical protein
MHKAEKTLMENPRHINERRVYKAYSRSVRLLFPSLTDVSRLPPTARSRSSHLLTSLSRSAVAPKQQSEFQSKNFYAKPGIITRMLCVLISWDPLLRLESPKTAKFIQIRLVLVRV